MEPLKIFQWVIMGLGVFIILGLLKKFNLFGQSENSKQADQLGQDAALVDSVTNITKNPNNVFLVAIKKKFGAKPSKAQMDSLLPNKPNMPKMVTTIKFDAHNK